MNLVGKILVWVILMMSLVFMAFTITVYATGHNWKNKVDDLVKQLQTQKDANSKLVAEKTELEKLQEEAVRIFGQEKAKIVAENQHYQQAITKLQADADRLNVDTAQTVSTLAAVHANLKKDREEIETTRTNFDTSMLERNQLLHNVIAANDIVQTYALNYVTIMETNRNLAKQLADALSVLQTLGETADLDRYTGIAPSGIVGQITEVRPNGLVELSLGADSGLVQGHRLHVYHEDSYLGQVEIVMTEPDKAAAKILPEFRTGTIKRGDHVASKLN